MHDKAAFEKIPEGERLAARGIEVGHIFYFGTQYSAPMKAVVAGPGGEQITVEMGSYGIGVSRLVGGIIEASHDENGCVWPEAVAPFKVGDRQPQARRRRGLGRLPERSMTAIAARASRWGAHDDRDLRPGAKFADMDLIGLPWQVIVGPKGVSAGKAEVKDRKTGKREEVPFDQVVQRFG